MKTVKLSLLMSLMLACGLVHAAPADTTDSNIQQLHPLYFEVQAGLGGMQTENSESPDNVPISYDKTKGDSKSSIAYRISGGYLFALTPALQIGPELGYEKYGDNDYDVTTGIYSSVTMPLVNISGYNFDLLLNAVYHFNENFYVQGKAGLAYVAQQYDGGYDNVNQVLPKVGVGAGYAFTPHVAVDFTTNLTTGNTLKVPTDIPNNTVARTVTFLLGVKYAL